MVGTYLHGPVLARNPRLADQLLEWVAGPLAPLADPQAELLHEERYAEVIGARGGHGAAPCVEGAEVELAHGRFGLFVEIGPVPRLFVAFTRHW